MADPRYQLIEDFKYEWPLERIKNMTLQEYSNRQKNSFCYWLEAKVDKLGSIWGGSSFKFGIYEKDQKHKNYVSDGRRSDAEYAWYAKYGESREEVFDNIRVMLVTIVEAAIAHRFEDIDGIQLSDTLKWKLAFIYSDFKLLNIFKKQKLVDISQQLNLNVDNKDTFYQLQRQILSTKPADQDYFEFGDQFWQALETDEVQIEVSTNNLENQYTDMVDRSLNQILYGPPGTGKTYHTINKAISIANPNFNLKQDRSFVKEEYQQLVEAGQIVFTTFHQSMSYEDFVEGIKPDLQEDSEGNESVVYRLKDGIFKEVVRSARKNVAIVDNQLQAYGFEDAWGDLIQLTQEKLSANSFIELPLLTDSKTIDIVNITSNGNLKLKPKQGREKGYTISYNRLRKLYDAIKDLSTINNIDKEFRAVIGGSNSSAYWSVLNYVSNLVKSKAPISKENKAELLPHVLIIDEINRGNVSAIFGELITLIEDSKRAGMPEQLEVTLPYSKEKFSVPSNLYIIGTMNTADRSVEALDSALRRRFVFEEMMPNYQLSQMQQMVFGYPASSILETINKRIELLIDRDHCIGHAYFLGKDEESVIDSFYKNIIPLLQEYFFGDYGKIGLVLGKGFVEIEESKSNIFADFEYDYKEDFANKPIYRIIDYRNQTNSKIDFGKAIELLMGNA
ncbi:McrB family protein [Sphingobacterium bambusae]|uniref:McrB family protein n=1 Tax=Sphingobacterium bambusae TaxID=662858 RepID=A0ABW6BLU9_9SPHI|nr:AAA family ATPase [Sphingobacterium bambusae]WPL51015.1 AAA family ATPase [Sphingobacterium bambusae]